MAYTNTRNTTTTTNRAAAGTKQKPSYLLQTGLFPPKNASSKVLAGVVVKEDITIPAGSYIGVYHNTVKKTEASPDYSLSIAEGTQS